MISPNEIKNGMVIRIDGDLWTVIQFQHVKPGKGGSFVKTKIRNLKTGNVLDRTFREADEIDDVFMEQKTLQYLYHSEGVYNFMDTETYEQFHIDKDIIGDSVYYLKDNMEVSVYMHAGHILTLSLPSSVNLKVTETEQGIRGDTAKGGNKPAIVETGLRVMVPLFIGTGDTISVDTRTGRYAGRA